MGRVAGVVLGVVLLFAGAAKMASGRRWPEQANALRAPRWAVPVVPWLELLLGALLVTGVGQTWAALAAVATLSAFTGFLVGGLRAGQRPPCACFGPWSSRPVGPVTVARNIVLVVIGLIATAG